MNHRSIINIILIGFLTMLITGCPSRVDSPIVNNEEGSIIFNSKDMTGINADVILSKGLDEHSGLPLIAGSFMLSENAKVYAEVRLLNRNSQSKENLMFHLDWIDPEGNSFFKKRVDILSEDIPAGFNSAISIPPGKRDTGNYKLRVYLFRELIAEKNFFLTSYNVDSANIFSRANAGKISAEISTGSKYDKEKDTPADTGSTFTLGEKERIYAGIILLNDYLYRGKEVILDIAWTYANDSSFFNKTLSYSPYDTITPIRSSVSINEKSREPGIYKLKVYLYGNLIKEKSFLLDRKKETGLKLKKIQGVDAGILFCSRYNKKTKKSSGISNNFLIRRKARVYAVVNLTDTRKIKDVNPEIKVEWISPGNISFYKKTYKSVKRNSSVLFSSSISISPDKRPAGKYKCRVFYNSSLISEKTFELRSSPL